MEDLKTFETLDPEDSDGMRKLAHRMVDDMLDYIASHRDRPVWTKVPENVAGPCQGCRRGICGLPLSD